MADAMVQVKANVWLKSGAVRTAGWFEVHACQLWVSLEDDVGPMICIVTGTIVIG